MGPLYNMHMGKHYERAALDERDGFYYSWKDRVEEVTQREAKAWAEEVGSGQEWSSGCTRLLLVKVIIFVDKL